MLPILSFLLPMGETWKKKWMASLMIVPRVVRIVLMGARLQKTVIPKKLPR
jgi:hypothetical protein